MPRRAGDRPRDRAKSGSSGKTSGSRKAGPRPLWSGQLRLSLVSVPVLLVSATRSAAHIALHQIHGPSGKRIHYDKVAEGVGSVDRDEIKKGVEVSKGKYVVLEDEEIEKLKVEGKRVLELVQFVEPTEIDPIWYEKPYFLLPDGELAEEPYGVIRDALKEARKVGVGQFVMRGRDYVAALKPCGAGLTVETLRFADEVQSASKIFSGLARVRADKDLLDLASELIDRKTRPFEPETFHDRYTEALRHLVEMHQRHEKPLEIDEEEEDAGAKVIDLVEALKRSVRAAEGLSSSRTGSGRDAAPSGGKAAAKKPASKPTTKSATKAPARKKAS
jgi:DNA end-binding protein Ku